MLVVNCIDITDINNDNYKMFINAVSDERRTKAERYHFINDSKRCICADLLLQYSLFQAYRQFVEMDIVYNEFGKPFMNHRNGFSYNISHSGKWVVIAYGSTEVGIDIEKIQRGDHGIADRFFTEEEKTFIYAATEEEKAKTFTQIWTLKESYIKYIGTGLSTRLDSFSVNPTDCSVTNHDGEIQKDIRMKSYLFDTDYYLSVCSTEDIITTQVIMLDDLIEFINKNAEEKKST